MTWLTNDKSKTGGRKDDRKDLSKAHRQYLRVIASVPPDGFLLPEEVVRLRKGKVEL